MFKLNAKAIVPVVKTGAKVALPAGAGFLFGRMGSEVAKHVSPSIRRFVEKNPTVNEGIVRALIGIPLGLVMAYLLSKKNMKTFFKLGALSVAGTLATAVQPVAEKHIVSATEKLQQMFKKGPALGPGSPPDVKLLTETTTTVPDQKGGGMASYYDFATPNRTAL